jgi:hypothetical protein
MHYSLFGDSVDVVGVDGEIETYTNAGVQKPMLRITGTNLGRFTNTLSSSDPHLGYPLSTACCHEFYNQIFDTNIETVSDDATCLAFHAIYFGSGLLSGSAGADVKVIMLAGNANETKTFIEPADSMFGGNPTFPPLAKSTINSNREIESVNSVKSYCAHTSPLGISWISESGWEEMDDFMKYMSSGISSITPNGLYFDTLQDDVVVGLFVRPKWHGYRLSYIPPVEE